MSAPVRSLPLVPWDCQGCGECCRTYTVRVTEAEKTRIDAQGWENDPELAAVDRIVPDPDTGDYKLSHRPDGACVFLGPENRCRIHAAHGPAAKPLACRLYPFLLYPAGDHWRAGIKFACPSVNSGRPAAAHADDLAEYAKALEAERLTGTMPPPPPLDDRQSVEWPDLLRFVKAISALLAGPEPIERKLRTVLAFAAVCRQSSFEKVRGPRLDEFLEIVAASATDEVPECAAVPRPGWTGRVLLRQAASIYSRRDRGANRGVMSDRRYFGRAFAAWRFARGTGRVPPVHGFIPETTFAAAEQPRGPLPAAAEELLTKYYRTKVESVQFCGAGNFRLPFWDGLDSLVLTFPVMMWLGRVLSAARPMAEAIPLAVRIADDNFGFNPLLGGWRQAWAGRALHTKGELPRLVAWYAA